ncbi:DMT family transporter [Celeribacter persicus]|uniref:Drug/metabolite transporter (DMT)-like permease n=1 Tax=Celeribacter persicus TaxID=1651082 RepID=A0A2T5HK37_9RHOB|nr:DMT family transporter [Celeribacter persicus]PTQ71937.1 drug/metabolite transporter (DMT)-like permease [Celeribacter persicus]
MAPQKTISAAAWAGLFAMGFLWGCSFLAVAILIREVPIYWVVAGRVSLAALMLWTYVLLKGLPVPSFSRYLWRFILVGALTSAVPFLLITWAQHHIPSGLAGILNASTAIFGVLFAALIFADEKLGFRKGTGVALGVLGIVAVIGPEALKSFDLTSLGQLAMIAATMSYGVSNSVGRILLSELRPEVAAAGMLTGAALVALPVAFVVTGAPPLTLKTESWGALLYLSIMSTSLTYIIYYKVMAAAGAGNTSLTTLIVAPVSIALGAAVLGESLPPQAYVGFGLIALGLLVIDGRILQRLRRREAA